MTTIDYTMLHCTTLNYTTLQNYKYHSHNNNY